MAARDNNFNFLRLMAALGVILAHSSLPSNSSFSIQTGFWAILVFFLLSGYLITQSWFRTKSVVNFVINRALRIVPAIVVGTLFLMLVIGPIMTTLSLSDYLAHINIPHAWSYGADHLPGVFKGGSVVGQLWTIPLEVCLYWLVIILGAFFLLNRKSVGLLIVFFAGVVLYSWSVHALGLLVSAELALMFLIGAAIWGVGKSIVWKDWVAAVLLILLGVCYLLNMGELGSVVAMPYLVFWFANRHIAILDWFKTAPDLSFGTYIYGFGIQRSIEFIDPHVGLITLFLTASVITLPLAWLSWTFIEKPALGFKRR